MIRLSWRQFRLQAAVAAAALAIVAIVLAISGPQIVHLYNSTIANCKAQGDCGTAIASFIHTDRPLQNALTALLFVVPGLIGIFWGAPLIARELEAGSFRLAWTQSVTRSRWLICKLGLVGCAAVAASGLLSLMATWWFHPIDRVNANQFAWSVFDARNIVPIGYAAFAFALGVTAGILTRRTLPAMATTLVGFIAARFAITRWVRPHLLSPVHGAAALDRGGDLGFIASPSGVVTFTSGNPVIPNSWPISSAIVDRAGHTQSAQTLHAFIVRVCPTIGSPPRRVAGGASGHGATQAGPSGFNACVAQLSRKFHLAVTYQPPSHYWGIQWLELAVYLVLSLLLAALCLALVRRRLS
ncbi:MAG TPA: ABC transporter permease subunit [Solirubrobacteraceae bacterium]|jgi:hypothetical protein